jgi:hypothetical protein
VNNGSFDNGLGEKVGFYYENHDTNKRLANHSARKYLVQKLKDNNVEDTNIMQISGHTSVQSVRNYSAVSEGKHKRISNVLVGADSDNSRALVPIQTTTASTNVSRAIAASTGADINLPEHPSICSQTNTSNRIFSMFYGANLHVNSMNVYMCDRH